jgi:hypothetical protein
MPDQPAITFRYNYHGGTHDGLVDTGPPGGFYSAWIRFDSNEFYQQREPHGPPVDGIVDLHLYLTLQTEGTESDCQRLRAAIHEHRSQWADDRCWLDDQKLYAVLGDGDLGDNTVGDPAAMRRNCDRFIAQRCAAGGAWRSYAELEAENAQLRLRLKELEPYVARIGLTTDIPDSVAHKERP